MEIYAGTFLLALVMLALEITFTRILSVVTWYHLAFFAISAAMLGMTAGATVVYLNPKRFCSEMLHENLGKACLRFSLAVPISLLFLCVIPIIAEPTVMTLIVLLGLTAACSLPFYFAGTAITLVLTKCTLPIGKVYASDLIGASLGCFLVLGGLELMDAPSLILLCGALGALAGFVFVSRRPLKDLKANNLAVFACLGISTFINSLSTATIRPVIVKDKIEPATKYVDEQWNSFSRIAVFPGTEGLPQMWGRSSVAPQEQVLQHHMNIDGCAGTVMRRFNNTADIEHLRYDVTNVAQYLRPHGPACVIGVGGARDIQSALLFGHSSVLGIEINPIFVDLLQNKYRYFANIADRPEVTLVVDEARSYLSRNDLKFSLLQMSLIDTWAATGAGAMTLSENSLYTVEAWQLFLDRLADDGLFTVSRWYDEKNLGETGRLLSLAVAALLRSGVDHPSDHLALVTQKRIATLIVSRQPFSTKDNEMLEQTCERLKFSLAASPVKKPENSILRSILASQSPDELYQCTVNAPMRFTAPTDEDPYFFNILRLSDVPRYFSIRSSTGVISGNLVATVTLTLLILALAIMTVVTIFVPLLLRGRVGEADGPRTSILWAGALYFSLIGCGFMLLEIAMIQRLSVFLGHPVYALGVLLFAFILSTGIGSFISERLPLTRAPWAYIYPLVACAAILVTRLALLAITREMVPSPMTTKIIVSIVAIFPVGIVLGLFFPTGMRLVRNIHPEETPWYWALNGIFGVLSSAVAVFISIFFGISVNFYISAVCYFLVSLCVLSLVRKAQRLAIT